MENFALQNPTKIHFGRGTLARAGAETAAWGKNALLLASPQAGDAVQKLTAILGDAGVKAAVHTVEGATATLAEAQKAGKAGRDAQAAVVIALGDTTTMDLGRITTFSLFDPDRLWDQLPKIDSDKAPERTVPLIQIPLQAPVGIPNWGGGALTNQETKERVLFSHESLAPKVCIADPEITYAQPKEETIDTMCTLIGWLLDGYFNGAENAPIQDRLIENLLETIMENLPVIQSNPANYTSRANLLWTGVMAASGFVLAGKGGNMPLTRAAMHLSGAYGLSTGRTYATMLPAFMLATYQDNPEPYARLGHRLFGFPIMSPTMEEAAHKGILQFRKWLHSFGMLHTLVSAGVPKESVDDVAGSFAHIANKGLMNGIVPFDADRAQLLAQLAVQ